MRFFLYSLVLRFLQACQGTEALATICSTSASNLLNNWLYKLSTTKLATSPNVCDPTVKNRTRLY